MSFFGLLSVIFIFVPTANAQGAVSYSFLEVVDYDDKPVANAEIKIRGSCVGGERFTDEKGQIKGGLPIGFGDCETFDFTISKDGYFPFADIFGISRRFVQKLKIELLINDQNRALRKAIAKEQSKREFFAAAKAGDTLAVRNFIKNGLDPNLMTSSLRGVPVPENEPIIMYAVSSGNGQTVKEFLSAGVDIRKKEELKRDILMKYLSAYPFHKQFPTTSEELAIYEEGAASLIEAGAKIDPNQKGSVTPLMIAADKSYVQIVKLLIKKKASLEAQDAYGKTALMYLPEYNFRPQERLEIAKLLIQAGVNINLLTSDIPYSRYNIYSCKTALSIAVENYDVEFVRFLLANGADVNLTCQGGLTSYEYALDLSPNLGEDQKNEILKILENAGAKR